MLTSITPLGERGRGQSWSLTVAAFLVGAAAGGALLGLLAAFPIALLPGFPGIDAQLAVIAVAAAAAAFVDSRPAGVKLPSLNRQVNENWLGRYRGWVYGAGFGFQLGAGLFTIVTTAAFYLMLTVCAVSGSLVLGGAIASAFGISRWLALLPAGAASSPAGVMRLGERMSRWTVVANRLTVACEVLVAIAAVVVLYVR